MSSGQITIRNRENFDNSTEQSIADLVYNELVPTFKVDVDDSEWKNADKYIKTEIAELEKNIREEISKLDENQKENTDNLDIKIKDILENKINEIDKRLGDNQGDLSGEIKAIKKEIENLKARKPTDVIVKRDNEKPLDIGIQHYQLPILIKIIAAKLNVYLVGPAGAGKTYAAIQCAKALGVEFYFTGAVASEFKLTGFIDAQGRIVSTEFRKAFENGGLFLFDEIDASYPQAVLAFNAALANDYMDFPDKRVERNKNFYCIAAANTYGQGADRQYVGRNQLDAASLDRFAFIDWKYDENFERELANNQDWSDYIQRIRRYIEMQKIRHVVSPRASINGAKLLAEGIPRETVEQTIIWKGLDEATKTKILENCTPKKMKAQATVAGEFTPKVKVGDNVSAADIIGEIEYPDRYGDYSTEEINAQFNGVITFISDSKEVEEEELIVEIDCYGNK